MWAWLNRLNWKNIGYTLLGLAIILSGVGLAIWLTWKLFTTASSDVVAATITASFTLLSGILIVVYSRRQEARQEIEQEHRKQKIPIYDNFLQFYFDKIFEVRTKTRRPITDKEIRQFRMEFTRRLMLWGSDEIVLKFSELSKVVEDENDSEKNIKAVFYFEQLLFLIRADLGHKNKGLKSGDLLRLFVTDIDKKLAEGIENEAFS